jgi:hypothetical protein
MQTTEYIPALRPKLSEYATTEMLPTKLCKLDLLDQQGSNNQNCHRPHFRPGFNTRPDKRKFICIAT